MLSTFVVSILTLYFALFLGVSGLAKIDHPFVELGGPSLLMRLKGLFFSSTVGRLLGVFEVVLAFLLALGIRIELVAIVNATVFGLFLIFKLFLLLTKLGSRCGCFGAHEMIAVDLPSVIVSILVLGLAVILAILAQLPSVKALNWGVTIIFLPVFGWITFKTLQRRRLQNALIRRMSNSVVV